MFLFSDGLSLMISGLSLIFNKSFLFSWVKILKLSKEGEKLQWSKWSQIALLFDGLTFLPVRGNTPICSPDLYLQGSPKKAPYFVYHSKVVFCNFFPYFSGGVHSKPMRFFWHQYGSDWTLYYAAADKNNRVVLCNKISSSDTTTIQKIFRQKKCTWQKENSAFSGQISEDRKCGRYP